MSGAADGSRVPARRGYGDSPVPPGAGGAPAAPGAATVLPVAGAGRYVLAGWWARVAATLIDLALLVLGAAVIVAVFALVLLVSRSAGTLSVIVGVLVALVAFTLALFLYPPAAMARWDGQTVGKRICRIRVVRLSGEPMDFSGAAAREVGIKWVVIVIVGSALTFGLAPLIDALWPAWDGERRALHDYLARTRVVRAAPR